MPYFLLKMSSETLFSDLFSDLSFQTSHHVGLVWNPRAGGPRLAFVQSGRARFFVGGVTIIMKVTNINMQSWQIKRIIETHCCLLHSYIPIVSLWSLISIWAGGCSHWAIPPGKNEQITDLLYLLVFTVRVSLESKLCSVKLQSKI